MTIILVFALAVIAAAHQDTTPTTLVIRGGTIVDVRDYGASARDLRNAVGNRSRIRDVDVDGRRPLAGLRQLGCRRGRPLVVHVTDRDRVAGRGQVPGDRGADPLTGPGHHRHAVAHKSSW